MGLKIWGAGWHPRRGDSRSGNDYADMPAGACQTIDGGGGFGGSRVVPLFCGGNFSPFWGCRFWDGAARFCMPKRFWSQLIFLLAVVFFLMGNLTFCTPSGHHSAANKNHPKLRVGFVKGILHVTGIPRKQPSSLSRNGHLKPRVWKVNTSLLKVAALRREKQKKSHILRKNISQIGSFPLVGVKIKNVWNHHLVCGILQKTFYAQTKRPGADLTVAFFDELFFGKHFWCWLKVG